MLELKVDKAAAKYITFNMYGNMAVSITILAYWYPRAKVIFKEKFVYPIVFKILS